MRRFPSLVVNIIFLLILFFHQLSLNNLDLKIRNSKTFSAFQKSILKFIRPSSNSIFNCDSPKGIKLITRLRLGLSHLREHKFRHNFQDTLNPICSCGDDIETAIHYLLHCPNYLNDRRSLLDNLQSIGENIHDKNDSQISELLLFGVSSNNDASDTCVLNTTIQYILATKRCDVFLTYSWGIRIILQQQFTLDSMIIGCLYLSFVIVIIILVQSIFIQFFSSSSDCINDLLNFSFCKYISFDPTSICSKLALHRSIAVHTLNFFEQILAG